MTAIDWTAIETALHTLVAARTGVATIWANEDGPQPPVPFAVLQRSSGATQDGGRDEFRTSTDLGKDPGEEVGVEAIGLRALTLSVTVRTASTKPGEDAHHYLDAVPGWLALPGVQETLKAANLAVIEAGDVRPLPRIVGGKWQSVAQLDIRLRTSSSVEERTGYVESAEIETTVKGADGQDRITRTDTYGG